ncbi:MAG TPA: glycosyltransferase [Gemmatimonadaceae bacterium]|nr:glycosyltransferase [Gemmatimonadaceae bacterium]
MPGGARRRPHTMMLAPVLFALPWLVAPLALAWRLRGSRSIDEFSPAPPADAPLLSVIVPARNEAHNVGRCVRTVLAGGYPRLELLVVDDHSTDDTAAVAMEAAAGDPRCRIVPNPPLPDGWFGKQWACATGAAAARGTLLLFTDADTAHGPELHVRAVNALRARHADLLTVAGRQELGSFWERLVQPQIFQLILARYGGTERVNRARRPSAKIANGQFLLFTRDAYDRLGGHATVRTTVAEDLALAQRGTALGLRVVLLAAERHLATRMYRSLGEIVRGWRKNLFAGGRDAAPFGRVGRALYPLALLSAPLVSLAPVIGLLLGLAGLAPPAVLLWGALATGVTLLAWAAIYAGLGHSPLNALGYPLGALVVLYVAVTAMARGRRVAWKGREYRHA